MFLLAAILILFGRASAAIPLFIATMGSFMALWIAANEVMTTLQDNVYSGIIVTLSQGIWIGLGIGIITAIIWPMLLRLMKDVKN